MMELDSNEVVNLENLSETALKKRIDAFLSQLRISGTGKTDVFTGDWAKDEPLLKDFEALLETLIFVRDYAGATRVLNAMRGGLDLLAERQNVFEKRQGAQKPEEKAVYEALVRYLVEWNNLAIRLIPNTTEEYTELRYYSEIIRLCADTYPEIETNAYRAKLGLAAGYAAWASSGGVPTNLTDEDLAFIENILQNVEAETLATVEIWRAMEDYTALIPLERTLARYFVAARKPNDAVRIYKQMLLDLQRHPAYHPVDSADLQMELGALFYGHKKYQVAAGYFEDAQEGYQSAGEAYEIHAAQAAGMVEDCRGRK